MSEAVLTVLGLSAAQQRRMEKSVGHFKTVTEFFSDAASAVKDTGISQAVRGATPWAGEAIEAFGEALPLAKFLAKFLSKLTKETDPFRLGYLACTLAYQQSAEQAFFEIGKAAAPLSPQKGELQAKLKELDAGSPQDLETFSYAAALEHPFIKRLFRVFSGCPADPCAVMQFLWDRYRPLRSLA